MAGKRAAVSVLQCAPSIGLYRSYLAEERPPVLGSSHSPNPTPCEDRWKVHPIAWQRTWRQKAERMDIIVMNEW